MKVGDPAQVSALNTWLRVPEDAESGQAAPIVAPTAILPAAGPEQQSRDTAESLLELDVWNGVPGDSHLLITAAAPQAGGVGNGNPGQPWVEHIFQPLL